jgi:hypothetical protein
VEEVERQKIAESEYMKCTFVDGQGNNLFAQAMEPYRDGRRRFEDFQAIAYGRRAAMLAMYGQQDFVCEVGAFRYFAWGVPTAFGSAVAGA